jgi:hypothetical protein
VVDWTAAFSGHCSCDERADVNREAYLSAFQLGDDFRELLATTGSVAGFNGNCWASHLWFDIDRESNLDAALLDARKLVAFFAERYRLDTTRS